jgi:hypothetical protein
VQYHAAGRRWRWLADKWARRHHPPGRIRSLRQLFKLVALGTLEALALPGSAGAQVAPLARVAATHHATKASPGGYTGGDIMATIVGGMALISFLFIVVVLVRRRNVP